MISPGHARALRRRIEGAQDALTYALEAIEAGNLDETENQLDIAANNAGCALAISETIADEAAALADKETP